MGSGKETGERITAREQRRLADLCNDCALCPCPDIREGINSAKTLFIGRDGLAPCIRTLEDAARVDKRCGAAHRFSNFLLHGKITGPLIKKAAGINAKRKPPLFPHGWFRRCEAIPQVA